jgi:aspartate/methionine/tyrosine aminotransferase
LEAANTVLRVDLQIYQEAQDNQYHPIDNPQGILLLNMAENNLSWPLLQKKIQDITKLQKIPHWVSNYTSAMGAPSFREALAGFLSRFLTKRPINADHLGCSAGATPVVEISAWILGERGDVAVFPAPAYPVYKQDIGNKAGLERYDLITHEEIASISEQLILTPEHLDKAFDDIQKQGKRCRLLVLTNPDNPTGGMYSFAQLENIADWCIAHEVHLVVNELYGLSLIDTTSPPIAEDYEIEIPFESFANIIQNRESDYLHLWYSLSKDFGASGFRVGLMYTLNEAFRAAYNNINAPHMVSNYTQWIFQEVLNDHDFLANYIRENQKALTKSYTIVIRYLRESGIPYVPSRGSLFTWIDLSAFLDAPTADAESRLWQSIYENSGVLITPADGFGNSKRGQFRLVYTAISPEELEIAMQRLVQYLKTI